MAAPNTTTMSSRWKTSLNPPSTKLTLHALLRKATENTTGLKSDVKYKTVVPVEDKRDPDTGVHSESSSAHNFSTRDTSIPHSESESANKVSISSVDTKSQPDPKSTTVMYGENKPHKWSGNATGGKTGLQREATVPVQDTTDSDSCMQSEPFITDICSTRDTSIPPTESVWVDNSDLELARSFDLVADSSSSIAIESPLDQMGRFACTFADVIFDDKSVESIHTLDMAEDTEKSSPDESSSLGETSSYDTGSTDEIDWNGGLNRHEDKASINEIILEDLGSLGKALDMTEEKEESSPNESTSLSETGGLKMHDDKAIINEISLEDLGSLGKVSISIQTHSVTTTRSYRIEYVSQTNAEEESPIEAASKEVSTNFGTDATRTEAAASHIIAKRKSLPFRLKKFLSKRQVQPKLDDSE